MYESLLTSPGGFAADFERLQRELQQLFGTTGRPGSIRAVASGAFPAINVGSAPDAVHIYAFAPGMSAQEFDVRVERGVLSIEGERKNDRPDDPKQPVYASERFAGRFRRAVSLPEDADPEQVSAHYRDGVLHIRVARREAMQPRRITIQ
ncbi:Hsp20/alpha crystallin family protein [Pseudazoarcus pumilus]|uniref:Heat-shock protein Hsp20 n=1 Tax=Pseudazoarcus pumilus TaxID=2067960 RepID=A0A2I6S2Q2_9RHOO|nr:Hsp20/alpha crystallin family protein [Pseudazoarcus pumilus]AUN93498.1 heat-shock protein Hsp20 [Pseudazoarcus pumilus]